MSNISANNITCNNHTILNNTIIGTDDTDLVTVNSTTTFNNPVFFNETIDVNDLRINDILVDNDVTVTNKLQNNGVIFSNGEIQVNEVGNKIFGVLGEMRLQTRTNGIIHFQYPNDIIMSLNSTAINFKKNMTSDLNHTISGDLTVNGTINASHLTGNYYDKTQIDNGFYTKSNIDSNIYTKTQSDANYYTKSYIDTNIPTNTTLTNNHYTKSYIDSNIPTNTTLTNNHYTKSYIDTNIPTNTTLTNNHYTKTQMNSSITTDKLNTNAINKNGPLNATAMSFQINNVQLAYMSHVVFSMGDIALYGDTALRMGGGGQTDVVSLTNANMLVKGSATINGSITSSVIGVGDIYLGANRIIGDTNGYKMYIGSTNWRVLTINNSAFIGVNNDNPTCSMDIGGDCKVSALLETTNLTIKNKVKVNSYLLYTSNQTLSIPFENSYSVNPNVGGAVITLTLPAITSAQDGSIFYIRNIGTAPNVLIYRNGFLWVTLTSGNIVMIQILAGVYYSNIL